MSKLIVLTVAYNAAKTLRRAVDSILKQTYHNWTYYIIDNGSIDDTREIIAEYAQEDARIVQWNYDKNYVYRSYDIIQDIARADAGDYLAILDSDDEYKPSFLKDMLCFVQEHNLDFATTGNEFISATDGSHLGNRAFSEHVICVETGFSYLEAYYGLLRPVWAKFFSLDILRQIDYGYLYDIRYGADTAFCLDVAKRCDRFGILAGSYYKYYVNPKSDSYTYDPARFEADRCLYKIARGFLLEKCGYVTAHNEEFLLLVYMNAIKDTLNVVLNARVPVDEKLSGVLGILSHEYTKQLAAKENFGASFGDAMSSTKGRKDLFANVADWLLSLQEVPDGQVESFCDMGEFACAAAEHADGWVFFNKLRIRLLIDQGRAEEGRAKLGELEEVLPGDVDLAAFRAQLSQ
ncbi:MAG: glycosyltransferase family 2 protein [Eubacteriales bacterium]|nr:glycosyltransferase family 2 protein [Christensenellaceae bacterium]MEA5066924.1 glycosyltransferase family 2 protein [Eubacteriales bacterium]